MKNAAYWRMRAQIAEEAAHRQAAGTLRGLEGAFRSAERAVQADMERWCARFAEGNGVSLSEARRLLTTRELEEFRWTVWEYIETAQQEGLPPDWVRKLENASARWHVSRLEAVQLGIRQQAERLFGKQEHALEGLLRRVLRDGSVRAAYEVQRGLGLGWDFAAPDEKRIDALLTKPWTSDGRTFRSRCWQGKAGLVDALQKELVQGALRGARPAELTERIRDRFQVARYQAGRLVYTETAWFAVRAQLEGFRALGVETAEIVETLDKRTCEACRGMDGKTVPLSQCVAGVTVPPFHPGCRGTVCPQIGDADGERIARNAGGEVYYVPADTAYPEWEKAFVQGNHAGFIAKTAHLNGLKSYKKAQDYLLPAANRDIITGARIVDQYGKAARSHAALYYDSIRKMKTDAVKIAENTGYPVEEIRQIKNYLFLDEHDLGDGKRRFDPDFAIAQSWQRLLEGRPESHDLTLLLHEIMERKMVEEGISQDDAHRLASRKYNYGEEAAVYYASLAKHKN